MNPLLDNKLCEDFPEIFKNRHADMTTTSMCWGFECGDGWEPLIRDLCTSLMEIAKAEKTSPPVASQVKEKYGTLRFYVDYSTDAMDDAIELAESKSGHICELCGDMGQVRTLSGWYSTRCNECNK